MDFQTNEKPSFLGGGLPSNEDLFSGFTFDEPKKPEIKPDEKLYIRSEKQVDTKTIIRKRVLLTPAVCDMCGFDVVDLAYSQNKLPHKDYDKLPESVQEIMKGAVQKHKMLTHTTAESLIVPESQLSKKWLSAEKRG